MKNVHVAMATLSLLVLCGTAVAQNKKLDSLLQVLEQNADPDQTEVLWGLAYELFDVDNAQALFYGKRAYDMALVYGDSLQIVKVGTTYGQLLRRMDRVDESIKVSTFLLPVSKRHSFRKYTKMLLNSLAVAHMLSEEYDLALENHFESLIMRKEEGDMIEIANALNNIGLIYYKIDDDHIAIDYYLQAIQAYEQRHDTISPIVTWYNIGLCYNNLKRYDTAELYFRMCLRNSMHQHNQNGRMLAELGFGETFSLLKNYATANEHFDKSLGLAIEIGDKRYQLVNLLRLAEVACLMGNLKKCDLLLKQAESLPAIKEYDHLLLEIYEQRANLYLRYGDFKGASQFLKKYLVLRETVFGAELNKRLRKVHVQVAQQENLGKIAAQSELVSLQSVAIAKQRWLIALCVLVVTLIGGLAVVLLRVNRRKGRINEILDLRVRERTVELEQQRDEIRHIHDEQVLAVNRFSQEVSASLATLRGLSFAAVKDLPREQAIYFEQAEVTAARIARAVSAVQEPILEPMGYKKTSFPSVGRRL